MPCSEARLAANRANASLSTGPKTPEGKAASRRNSFQHGLTGGGIVVPGEDAAEIDRRSARFEAELAGDGSATTQILAQRLALLSVRIERSARHESATTAERVRQAGADFDAARQAEARRRFDASATNPTERAALLALPEGVDLLLTTLRDLRSLAEAEAEAGSPGGWGEEQAALLARCLGAPGKAAGTGPPQAIVARIDAEVERLEAHRRTLDEEAVADLRAGVVARALVADDPATLLARKYEAATERSIFRTLREIRTHRAGPPSPRPLADATSVIESIAATERQLTRIRPTTPPLGSFFPEPPAPPEPPLAAPFSAGNPPREWNSRYPDRKKRPRLT